MLGRLYTIREWTRALVLTLGFQALLWASFALAYLVQPQAWTDVAVVPSAAALVGGGVGTFFYILGRNLLLMGLILLGNLFVRFGGVTPGLFILALQGVQIGWMAGSNGFEVPFLSLSQANWQYLRVGLWETTAYALAAAVTLTKSRYVAKTFPAKEWSEIRSWKEIRFSPTEKWISALSLALLVLAAGIEAYTLLAP